MIFTNIITTIENALRERVVEILSEMGAYFSNSAVLLRNLLSLKRARYIAIMTCVQTGVSTDEWQFIRFYYFFGLVWGEEWSVTSHRG